MLSRIRNYQTKLNSYSCKHTRQMCNEFDEIDEKTKLTDPVVHVEWWDNFSKCYAFQKQDMKSSNFAMCLWTVMGVQRQSLPSQPHRMKLSTQEKLKSKLLTREEFKVSVHSTSALPDDLLDADLTDHFKESWLNKVDKITNFWNSRFRGKNVTRVRLKLQAPAESESTACTRCGNPKCSCFMNDIVATQSDGKGGVNHVAHSVHMSDHISGSPDGLLNFFPSRMKPFNIGSNAGLARIVAEFHIENWNSNMVKMVNTDVQIYERIMKVRSK